MKHQHLQCLYGGHIFTVWGAGNVLIYVSRHIWWMYMLIRRSFQTFFKHLLYSSSVFLFFLFV